MKRNLFMLTRMAAIVAAFMLSVVVPATGQWGQDDRKIFEKHTVKAGETAYSIARGYEISLTTLIEDNPKVDPALLPVGTVLNIRKTGRGAAQAGEIDREWQQVRDDANKDDGDGYIYHLVAPGETLYSLGRTFGIPADRLAEINHLQDGTLRANSIIRIPAEAEIAAAGSAASGIGTTGVGSGSAAAGAGTHGTGTYGTGPGGATATRAAGAGASGSEVQTWAAQDMVAKFEGAEPQSIAGGSGDYFRPIGGTPNIALMLPLDGTTAAGNDFTEFYRGALIALEDLKAKGRSINMTLYNTARSADKVLDIVSLPEFSATNLIIGPVYESEIFSALQFADAYGVPIVSPLAPVRRSDSKMFYQMSPTPATKYDKMRPLFGLSPSGEYSAAGVTSGDLWSGTSTWDAVSGQRPPQTWAAASGQKSLSPSGQPVAQLPGNSSTASTFDPTGRNIILVSSLTGNDKEFEGEITALLEGAGANFGRFTVGGPGDIANMLDWNRENVLVVLGGTELAVDKALATISSQYNNASARRARKADITVVGSSKWASHTIVDKNLYFKLNVCFVTSYYITRTGVAARFEGRYLEAYGHFPTRAAFRGYDAVALFAGALFESGATFGERIAKVGVPLATPYRFVGQTNEEWTVVSFSDDYNIVIQ